jgi:LuxR family glucitol operon transcriptional activator
VPVPIVADELTAADASKAPPNRGRLVQLHKNFAFVDAGGSRFFFHRGSWLGSVDFNALGEGTIVEFEIGSNDKGPCAVAVRPINGTGSKPAQNSVLLGAIKVIAANHGFLKLDSGGDLFFHREDCTPATRFNNLAMGDRMRCILHIGDDGRRRGVNVELYSGR